MLGFKELREAIIEKINNDIQSLDVENRKIAVAIWSPADMKTGQQPVAIVLPEELDSSYQETMNSRRRVFIFRVNLVEEISEREQTEVEKEISDGIDYLIDLFDRKDVLDLEGLLTIKPTPSVWGNVELPSGWARVATITLRCDVIEDN